MNLAEDFGTGRPNPADPVGRRERSDDRFALLLVGLIGNPVFDRVAVLRRDEAHGDERLDLGKAVLMQFRWSLRD